jgi:carbon storage regulator
MLILTRKPGESIYIGDQIKVTIVEIKGHQIRVGIDAPTELRIYREEIYLQILEENKQAAGMEGAGSLDSLAEAWKGKGSNMGGRALSGVAKLSSAAPNKVSTAPIARPNSISGNTTTPNSTIPSQPVIQRRRKRSDGENEGGGNHE